jgi:Lrp/AsnC family transcriptional regulator, leucine-responsive regulatory protein
MTRSETAKVDDTDLRLLALLQEHGRISQQELAQTVGLSSPAVGERLRKLEERGIIRHFTAVVDAKKLGRDVTAFIFVGVSGSKQFPAFLERATSCAEVLECHSVTGQGSHMLKIRTENTSTLEKLLAEIQAWPGVQWSTTSIVLSTMKETMKLEVRSEERGASSAEGGGP